RRQLHWKLTRTCPSEDAVNIRGSLPHELSLIDSVGDQAAAGSIEAKRINRRQTQARSQLDDQCASGRSEWAWGYNQATISFVCNLREHAPDVSGVPHACP